MHNSVLYLIKSKLCIHENIGWGPIHLPEEELHTSGYWFSFSEEAAARKSKNEMQFALLGKQQALDLLNEAEGNR